MSQMNLNISSWEVVWPRCVVIGGLSMIFAPLTVAAFDYVIACGEAVFHIMGQGRLESARLTPGVVIQPGGTVVCPAAH